jgi:hypothetical protein
MTPRFDGTRDRVGEEGAESGLRLRAVDDRSSTAPSSRRLRGSAEDGRPDAVTRPISVPARLESRWLVERLRTATSRSTIRCVVNGRPSVVSRSSSGSQAGPCMPNSCYPIPTATSADFSPRSRSRCSPSMTLRSTVVSYRRRVGRAGSDPAVGRLGPLGDLERQPPAVQPLAPDGRSSSSRCSSFECKRPSLLRP